MKSVMNLKKKNMIHIYINFPSNKRNYISESCVLSINMYSRNINITYNLAT